MYARLAAALALGLALCLPATADVVHLEGGRQIVGRVIEDGDTVRIEIGGGTMSVPRTRVAKIERAELPSDALDRRFEALTGGDVDGALALAEEARTAQLAEAAGRYLARAMEWAPEDARVRDALWRWRVFERALPANPAAAERLRRDVGKGAHVHRSEHWRIAHDVTSEAARDRAMALESAWDAFHRLMDDIGVRPEPIDDRLEAMLFHRHTDWVRATGAAPEALAGLNGIYLGPTGRILLFDPRTAPEAKLAHEQVAAAVAELAEKAVHLDSREQQLLEIRAKVEAWRPTPADREGALKRKESLAEIDGMLAQVETDRLTMSREAADVDAHRERVRRFWDEETVAATMHEACHQIAFATGVSHPHHPLWLNEGLATLFEAISIAELDPRSKRAARLRDIRTLRAEGRGGDLRRILTGAAFAERASSEAYAEAWALTTFLVLRHPEGLARMLNARPDAGSSDETAARDLALFVEAFGDIDAIEREWRRFVDRL